MGIRQLEPNQVVKALVTALNSGQYFVGLFLRPLGYDHDQKFRQLIMSKLSKEEIDDPSETVSIVSSFPVPFIAIMVNKRHLKAEEIGATMMNLHPVHDAAEIEKLESAGFFVFECCQACLTDLLDTLHLGFLNDEGERVPAKSVVKIYGMNNRTKEVSK